MEKVIKERFVFCSFLGQSKGYGFVEYAQKETALQAKSLLDGRHLDGCTLCCDWLEASHVTFESLHSKCLYVDRLPSNFRDMAEFRKTFSPIVNPPYCQVRTNFLRNVMKFLSKKLIFKLHFHFYPILV